MAVRRSNRSGSKTVRRKQSNRARKCFFFFFLTERIYATEHFKEVRRFLFINSKGTSLLPVKPPHSVTFPVQKNGIWQNLNIFGIWFFRSNHNLRLYRPMGKVSHCPLRTSKDTFFLVLYVFQVSVMWPIEMELKDFGLGRLYQC